MTDLTDKWKKGELPDGWYWCECYNEEIKILYYDGDSFELDDPETKNYYFFLPKDIEEISILDEVPTFDEWQQLKALLKECKDEIDPYRDFASNKRTFKNLTSKINQALGEDK